MNIQKIIEDIKINDEEINKNAIQTIYENYKLLSEENIVDIIPSIIYYLWKLPKFSVQKEFILELLNNTDERLRFGLFKHLIEKWDEIQLVRMDKFYYLIKRILEYYSLNIETIPYLFDITHNTGLRTFIIRCIVDRLIDIDEEIETFLIEFTSKCPPALLFSLKSLKFKKEIALKYAKNKGIGKRNRLALYSMIK